MVLSPSYPFFALLFAILTKCCPLHADRDAGGPLNNQRRSTLEEAVRTSIDNVRVFDGVGFTAAQTVCLEGGWIVGLGRCTDPAVKVNGTGKFLIPGLIDSHLHLTDVQSLEQFTSYGCTTAMHMNCGNYTQCDINANQPGLASFKFASQSAVGYGSPHSETASRPNSTLIFPDTDVVQFAQYGFNNGSDYSKITAEIKGPTVQQQIDMIRVAHQQFNKQSMTHASAIMSYDQAVQSKTDGIQHVPDDGILDIDTIKRILDQNQFVTPTINVFEFAYRSKTLEQYFKVIPGSNRSVEHAETNAKLLYDHGVPLIAGTDSVGMLSKNNSTVQVPWGLSLHFELQNFVNILGMSPGEALNSATREAAKWHRMPDRGSIALEKRADLVLLNENPLLNISNTLSFEKIWVMGVPVSNVAKMANSTILNPALTPVELGV
ncbi:amidohydrolase family protein [Sarocladium implicatum]|nr:amidohydrolase family protein [Sarocladium implicatum]